MRNRWMLLLAGLVVIAFAAPATAHAQDPGTTELPEGVGIGDSIYLTGATVTAQDGDTEPRTFDDYDAAVFVQSWLGCAYFCGPGAATEPPTDLTVYRVDSSGSWNGSVGTVTSYFATDGTTAYVAFPGLVVWTDPSQIPEPSEWFVAPARVIDAFNQEAELEDTTGVQTGSSVPPGSVPEDAGAAEEAEDDSSSTALIIGGVVAALALVAAGLWWRGRRGDGRSDSNDDPAPEPADATTH